jgi:flagellar hook-length control protein FliK
MQSPGSARAGLHDWGADVAGARQAASTLSAAAADVLRSSIGSWTEHTVESNARRQGAAQHVEVSLDRTGDEMRAALDAERAAPGGVTPGEGGGASAGGAGADGAAADAHAGDHPGARAAIAASALNGSTPGAPVLEARAVSTVAALESPIDDRQVADQLVQAIRVQLRGGVSDATVRLKPEHLGEVTISLRVEGSTVSAMVQAEVAAVRHWIEANESTLRENLSRAGLELGQLVVCPDDRGARQHPPRDSEQRRKGVRSRAHAPEALFTITV